MAHFYLSAAHKSSGKTTLSIGLCAALHGRGLAVQPFKKGPDYIDPLWMGAAAGRDCHNLDLYVEPEKAVLERFQRGMNGADIGVIEGNKGLFDGLSVDGSDSNAAVAKLTRSPVILVIDTRGMTRGIAPLLQGYTGFDEDVNIAGVILNHVGGTRHEGKLRESVATYTDLPVLGAVQRDSRLVIDERHLGLMPSNEHAAALNKIQVIRDIIADSVDIDQLLQIAGTAPVNTMPARDGVRDSDVRVGVAKDAAFGFYYASDIEAFSAAGAELVYFDTLHDQQLPAVDGLFIGGGFPESCMQELEDNASMRTAVKEFIEAGKPVYAECGGMMYLCQSLTWHGKQCKMAGVIKADAVMSERPQGRGYVTATQRATHPWLQEKAPVQIAAHEFHYSRLENLEQGYPFAYDMKRGFGIDGAHDGLTYKNLLANYTHLRDVEGNHWVERFVEHVRQLKQRGTDV